MTIINALGGWKKKLHYQQGGTTVMIKSEMEKHQKIKEASVSHQSVKLHAGKEEGGEVLVFQTGMKTKSLIWGESVNKCQNVMILHRILID